MSPSEKTEFEFATKCLSELAVATSSDLTRPVANALRDKLAAHVVQIFPDLRGSLTNLAPPRAPSTQESLMQRVGPKLWERLHTRAKTNPTDTAAELLWLQNFTQQIPCGICASFYADYLAKNPPTFADYQGWMIGLHNAVNVKRKVAIMPDAEARARWK